MHLATGAPKKHLREEHSIAITRKTLEDNTEIIDGCNDTRRLNILEALYIKENNPKLNIQAEDLQALPSRKKSRKKDEAATTPPHLAEQRDAAENQQSTTHSDLTADQI